MPEENKTRTGTTAVRIRGVLRAPAEHLADILATDLSAVVNDSLRRRLEAEGLWPWPPAEARRRELAAEGKWPPQPGVWPVSGSESDGGDDDDDG